MVKSAFTHSGKTPHPIDLRRRQSRDLAEILVERANWTLPDDQRLINAVYRDGTPASHIAKRLNRSPRATRQRVHTLVTRLLSQRFQYVLDQRETWTKRRRRIADACVLQGMSIRRASDALGESLHTVRRHMDVINALANEEAAR